MQVLSMMGYTGTPIGQLHNELFRAGGPHKFPYRYMDAKTVTDLLHSCGGVVVLAHPGQYKADNVMEMMIEEHMLDGIELNIQEMMKKQESILHLFVRNMIFS